MKFLFLLGVTLGLITSVNAQKIKKETLGSFSYVQPPSNYVLQGKKTYFVEVSGNSSIANAEAEVKNICNFQGFEKTMNKENADFIVDFSMYVTTFTTPEYDKKIHEKEKDGVKTTTYTYSYSGKYTHKVSMVIYAAKGNIIYTNESGATEKIYKSSSISKADAGNKYSKKKDKVSNSVTRTNIVNLNYMFNEVFASVKKSISMKVIKIKGKKFDYSAFNTATEALKAACGSPVKTDLKASITAWEADLEESNPENRKARVNKNITAGAHYNIALAYFTLGEYAKSKEAFNKATEFDKNVTLMHQVLTTTAADMSIRLDSQIKAIEKQKAEVLVGKSCFEYNSLIQDFEIVMTSEDGTNFKGSIDNSIHQDDYIASMWVEFDAKLSNEILIVTGWMELEGLQEDFSAEYKLIRGDQIQLVEYYGTENARVFNYVNCDN